MNTIHAEIQKKYRAFREVIDPWSRLGTRKFTGGTLRIGHIPHCAPEGYLHALFAGLEDSELRDLQNEIDREFHKTLQKLMRLHNGMNLFNGQLSVYGLRTSYRRSEIDMMMEQPFDMVQLNTMERPDFAPGRLVFIGSIGDDRQRIAMNADGSIGIWDGREAKLREPMYESAFDLLVEEVRRMNRLFDRAGRRIDSQDCITS